VGVWQPLKICIVDDGDVRDETTAAAVAVIR
jgi:hypothetical protein